MGEPLEVPQQQQQQHNQASSEDWDSPLLSVSHSRSYGNNNTKASGPRRTRHRVDAGEPRGCFNTTSPQFFPRNIFTSPASGYSNSGANSSPLGGPSAFHGHHHSSSHVFANQQHSSQHHHHNSPGHHSHNNNSSSSLTPIGGNTGSSLEPSSYYFQPMKMLSEFISSTTAAAAAAAAAAATAGTSPPSSGANSNPAGSPPNHYSGVPAQHQLLLREMLQKSGRINNNNNNTTNKCGYEEDVMTVVDENSVKQENSDSNELPGSTGDGGGSASGGQALTLNSAGSGGVSSATGNGNTANCKGANSPDESQQSNKSTDQSQQQSQMRINGCKKRKLYQPQRSEFDEAEDELDDDDYDAATAADTAEATSGGEEQDKDDGELMLDDDEEELAMSIRERERDAREHGNSLVAAAAAAPLTRQLLTERASANMNDRKPSPSKYLSNHMENSFIHQWKENFKSTLVNHISDLVDTQFSLLFPPGGVLSGGNHQAALTSGRHTPSHTNQNHSHHHHNNNNISNSQHSKSSPTSSSMDLRRSASTPPHKNSALTLLNGGTVHNNNNNSSDHNKNSLNSHHSNNNNNSIHNLSMDKMSPEIISGNKSSKYLERERERQPVRNSSASDFLPSSAAFPRFPFQGSAAKTPSHFSSALVGLSQAAHLQQQAAVAAAVGLQDMLDDNSPLSLVVTPKKKRHKVTDTRLTPRAVSRLLGQVDAYGDSAGTSPVRGQISPPISYSTSHLSQPSSQPPIPVSLPTSVAIPNPSLSESRLFTPYVPLFHHPGAHHPHHPHHRMDSPPMGQSLIHPALLANPADYVQQLRAEMREQQARNGERELREREREREREKAEVGSAGSDSGETNSYADMQGAIFSCNSSHSSSTLTPMHLRKAKLMFFWVRYPSSAVLKMYFPDIKFNKNNTAQLVKWFSNFREFYYIQMEKYARQALSEGIKNSEDLHVSVDNELYRVLNLHYNRNNHIEVPTNFRFVVEQTLREFFKAIQTGKDSEQSWKKAIYKIIARLDDPVPEYFKSPNFLEQLE